MIFKTIPFQNRGTVYSNSIKMHNHLWVVPTYEVGEVWAWYGSGLSDHYRVIQVFKETNQILLKVVKRVQYTDFNFKEIKSIDISDGDYKLYHLDRYGYASSGTPSLRIRIS